MHVDWREGRSTVSPSAPPGRTNEQLNPVTYHTTRTTFSDSLPHEIHTTSLNGRKLPGTLALGTCYVLTGSMSLDIQRHRVVSSVPLLEFEIPTSSWPSRHNIQPGGPNRFHSFPPIPDRKEAIWFSCSFCIAKRLRWIGLASCWKLPV